MEKFEIFFIRHADTVGANREGVFPCDIGLSDLGEEQARLLGERFSGKSFDAILSSPLIRAVRTAAEVTVRLENAPVIEIVPELMEKGTEKEYVCPDVGFLEKYYPDIKLCNDGIYGNNGIFPRETNEDNTARARAVIKYLKERFGYGKRIAVFSHGTFGTSFIAAALGIEEGGYIFSLNNTSVTKIKYTEDGKTRLSFHNDISHLQEIIPEYEFEI